MKQFTITAKARQSEYLVKAINRLVECVSESSIDHQADFETIVITCMARQYEDCNKILDWSFDEESVYLNMLQHKACYDLIPEYLERVADNETYLTILHFMHWSDPQICFCIQQHHLHSDGLTATAIEFAMQIGQTIYAQDSEYCGGHDKIITLAEQYDTKWGKLTEKEQNEASYTDGIEDECDTFLRQNGYTISGRFGGNKIPTKTSGRQADIAWVLVQITEDYSKQLVELFPRDFENMDERAEQLYEYAEQIVNSDKWREMPDGPSAVYTDFMEAEINRLRLQNAKFKVGDEAIVLYDYEVRDVVVKEVCWSKERKMVYYKLADNDDNYVDHEVFEGWVYRDAQDLIDRLQKNLAEKK